MVEQHTGRIDHLAERYGRRRPSGRGVTIAVIIGVVLVSAVVAWFGFRSANDPLRAAIHSWEEPQGAVLPIMVEIDRAAGTALSCDLVAVDDRMIVVGQLELEVPAGPREHFRVTADIPLEGNGIAPKLRGCRTTD